MRGAHTLSPKRGWGGKAERFRDCPLNPLEIDLGRKFDPVSRPRPMCAPPGEPHRGNAKTSPLGGIYFRAKRQCQVVGPKLRRSAATRTLGPTT